LIVQSAGPHFAAFCATVLQQPQGPATGEPLTLEDWEGEIFDAALELDDDGLLVWLSIVLVLPRKNGKTTLLAAYALYRALFDEDNPEVLLAAASDRQAGRLFDAAAAMVRRSPHLMARLIVREYVGEIRRADGAGRILRMSSSPERLHGYNPSLVVADELAQWGTPSLRRAWAALTTAGGARRLAQVFTISTAGQAHERATGILGRTIDGNDRAGTVTVRGARYESRNLAARTLCIRYEAPTTDRHDLDAILAANPASWITREYLARQAANPELTDADFLQLHGCVWSSADDRYTTVERLEPAVSELELVRPGEPVTLGFDGSRTTDSTVLVLCTMSGHLELLGGWERPDGVAGKGWEVPVDEVDEAVSSACERFKVLRGYFDPPYWRSEIAGWARDYGDVIAPWSTNRPKAMGGALERFRTDLHSGRVSFDGSALLRAHLLAARLITNRAGGYLDKPTRADHIDGAVAAVLAYEARCDAIAAGEHRRSTRSRIPVSL
jgi:phage terminase large subunit-like protein